MLRSSRIVALIAAIVTSSSLNVANAAATSPQASITDLGPDNPAEAFAINRQGSVVGQAFFQAADNYHGFLWTQRNGMQDLGPHQGLNQSLVRGINDWGQMTGNSGTGGPYLWSRGEVVLLHGLEDGGEARGINDWTHIVGVYFPNHEINLPHGFLWTPNGGVRDLGIGNALAINDFGVVAGLVGDEPHRPAIWGPLGGVHFLDLPNISLASGEAWAINLKGETAGSWVAYPPNNPYGVGGAAMWTSDGHLRNLGHLPCAGSPGAIAAGINNHEEVVGWSCTTDPSWSTHAFLFRHGRMLDLNSLILVGSGWTLVTANAINDRDEVVGAGLINGEQHAYRLKLPAA